MKLLSSRMFMIGAGVVLVLGTGVTGQEGWGL
jgi:hypothetical protein